MLSFCFHAPHVCLKFKLKLSTFPFKDKISNNKGHICEFFPSLRLAFSALWCCLIEGVLFLKYWRVYFDNTKISRQCQMCNIWVEQTWQSQCKKIANQRKKNISQSWLAVLEILSWNGAMTTEDHQRERKNLKKNLCDLRFQSERAIALCPSQGPRMKLSL